MSDKSSRISAVDAVKAIAKTMKEELKKNQAPLTPHQAGLKVTKAIVNQIRDYQNSFEKSEELSKTTPPEFSEEAMHGLKSKHGTEAAFKIAWAAHNKHKVHKAAVAPGSDAPGQTLGEPNPNQITKADRKLDKDVDGKIFYRHKDAVLPNDKKSKDMSSDPTSGKISKGKALGKTSEPLDKAGVKGQDSGRSADQSFKQTANSNALNTTAKIPGMAKGIGPLKGIGNPIENKLESPRDQAKRQKMDRITAPVGGEAPVLPPKPKAPSASNPNRLPPQPLGGAKISAISTKPILKGSALSNALNLSELSKDFAVLDKASESLDKASKDGNKKGGGKKPPKKPSDEDESKAPPKKPTKKKATKEAPAPAKKKATKEAPAPAKTKAASKKAPAKEVPADAPAPAKEVPVQASQKDQKTGAVKPQPPASRDIDPQVARTGLGQAVDKYRASLKHGPSGVPAGQAPAGTGVPRPPPGPVQEDPDIGSTDKTRVGPPPAKPGDKPQVPLSLLISQYQASLRRGPSGQGPVRPSVPKSTIPKGAPAAPAQAPAPQGIPKGAPSGTSPIAPVASSGLPLGAPIAAPAQRNPAVPARASAGIAPQGPAGTQNTTPRPVPAGVSVPKSTIPKGAPAAPAQAPGKPAPIPQGATNEPAEDPSVPRPRAAPAQRPAVNTRNWHTAAPAQPSMNVQADTQQNMLRSPGGQTHFDSIHGNYTMHHNPEDSSVHVEYVPHQKSGIFGKMFKGSKPQDIGLFANHQEAMNHLNFHDASQSKGVLSNVSAGTGSQFNTDHGSYSTKHGADGSVDLHYKEHPNDSLMGKLFGRVSKKLGSFKSAGEAHSAMQGHHDAKGAGIIKSEPCSECGNVAKDEVLHGGKGDYKEDSEFDSEELSEGIEHESSEHGEPSASDESSESSEESSENVAKEITKDHLSERPDYYSELKELDKVFDFINKKADLWGGSDESTPAPLPPKKVSGQEMMSQIKQAKTKIAGSQPATIKPPGSLKN